MKMTRFHRATVDQSDPIDHITDPAFRMAYLAAALTEEAGEVAGEIKKDIRNDGGRFADKRKAKILDEAGDVLHYLACLLDEQGFTLADAAIVSLAKREEKVFAHGRITR